MSRQLGQPSPNGERSAAPDRRVRDLEAAEEDYDPGSTLSRGMTIACSLVLLFFAVLSCGFIISVLSLHR